MRYTRMRGKSIGGQAYIAMAYKLMDIYEEEMEEAAKASVAEGKAYISIAGTGKTWTWNGQEGAPSGRIQNGVMQRAMEYRMVRGIGVGFDVGWINDYEDYFGAQDLGFSAGGARPDQDVEGMGMMAHLRFYNRDRVQEALDRAAQRVIDGL